MYILVHNDFATNTPREGEIAARSPLCSKGRHKATHAAYVSSDVVSDNAVTTGERTAKMTALVLQL